MRYNGYLAPHISLIRELSSRGLLTIEITRQLYDAGVRPHWVFDERYRESDIGSMSKMVGVVIRKIRAADSKAKRPASVTRIVQDWQTWTPEMQEAEFLANYTR